MYETGHIVLIEEEIKIYDTCLKISIFEKKYLKSLIFFLKKDCIFLFADDDGGRK